MIEVKSLTKKFRANTPLKKVDLTITGPKIIALIGRNGVGKSTFLKILAGHYKASSGNVKVFGEAPFNNLYVAANSILIDDRLAFPSNLTLMENFQVASKFYLNFDLQLAENLLQFANISKRQYYQHLSKGQAAAFRLIYGLAARCELTLLDEPMNGMDEAIRNEFYRAILKDYIAHPRVIIIASHYLREMEHLLEEVICIHEGRVLFYEELEQLQGYAVSYKGDEHLLKANLDPQAIITEKRTGPLYEAILRTDLAPSNFTYQPVTASEVFGILTNGRSGGIDDAFK